MAQPTPFDSLGTGAAPGTPKPEATPFDNLGSPETAHMAAAPTGVSAWLTNLESDVRYGGQQTAVGRFLHKMGYQAPENLGKNNSAGEMMVSPIAGATFAAHGVVEGLKGNVARGAGEVLSGVGEAAQIPMMLAGGPESEAAAGMPRAAGQVVGKTARAVTGVVNPDVVGIASPRLAHVVRVAQNVAELFPEADAATLDKRVDEALSQSKVLKTLPATGAKRASETGEALATIKNGATEGRTPSGQMASASRQPEAAGTASASESQSRPPAQSGSGVQSGPSTSPAGKPPSTSETAKSVSSSAPRVLKGDEARDFIQKQQAPLENQSTSKPAGAQPPNGNNKVTNLPDGFTPLEGSSALKGFKYNFKTEELEVISKDGAHYVHDNVPAEQARQFAASDSPGTFWNKNLRGGAEGRENASTFKMVGGERVKIPKAVKDVPNPFETPEWKASNAADQAAQKQSAAENGGKLNLQRAQQLKDQANGIRVSSQGGLHQVLSGTNKNSGILLAQDVPDNPGAARVAVHWVDEGIRGQGQGTKQLETLAQHLKASGKTTLFSDRDMTDAARGTWDKISAAHPGAITKTPAGYTFDLTKLKQ